MRNYMILDLQYGSTGKGLLAGYLAITEKPDVAVSAFGPNAGHTFVLNGNSYMHKMVPMGVFSPDIKQVLIGPGSVLDITTMTEELRHLTKMGWAGFEVLIHPNTPILMDHHADQEAQLVRIGSTMKGTAACVIEKMSRPTRSRVIASQFAYAGREWFRAGGIPVKVAGHIEWVDTLLSARKIQIEGAQGTSLSIHGPFYPYCTSRDVGYHQLMADCGIPKLTDVAVIGSVRTFPIRVANRFDEEGNQIGTSGDYYPDQVETSWEELGLDPEFTTVTKLQRRVFTFSYQQFEQAVINNGVDFIFLNFCNYLGPAEVAKLTKNINDFCEIGWRGWGPEFDDIEDMFLMEQPE